MINIVVCGTPGTGKSSLIERLKETELSNQFKFLNISEFAHANDCISEYDEELDTSVIDEKKLYDAVMPVLISNRRTIIEDIHCDLLEESDVDWVFVCTTNTTILYDRLKLRGYNDKKIEHNMDNEIFQIILDDAKDIYQESVTELVSNNHEDLDRNVEIVTDQIRGLTATLEKIERLRGRC